MSEEKDISILNGAETPSLELLERYLRGEVSDEERELVEQLMVDDPLMADAIEGLRMIEDKKAMRLAIRRIHRSSLIGLDNHIQKRERLSKRQSRVAPKSHWQMYSAVAAAVALLFTTIYLIGVMRKPAMESAAMAQNADMVPAAEGQEYTSIEKSERPEANALPIAADSISPETLEDGLFAELEQDNLDRVGNEGFGENIDETYLETELDDEDQKLLAENDLADRSDAYTYSTQPTDVSAPAPTAPVSGSSNANIDPITQNDIAVASDDAGPVDEVDQPAASPKAVESLSQDELDEMVVYEDEEVALSERPRRKQNDNSYDFDMADAPVQSREERTEGQLARGRMMEQLLREAADLYEQNAYLASLTKVDEVLITEPENVVAHHFRGRNYLALSEKSNAIKSFEIVARAPASSFYAADQWQLAQLYVEQRKKAKARRLLRKIIVENGPHAVEAAALMETIE
ncbi:MAG: hypothetical protein AAF206_19760 [Bacteroidota bacterium]